MHPRLVSLVHRLAGVIGAVGLSIRTPEVTLGNNKPVTAMVKEKQYNKIKHSRHCLKIPVQIYRGVFCSRPIPLMTYLSFHPDITVPHISLNLCFSLRLTLLQW